MVSRSPATLDSCPDGLFQGAVKTPPMMAQTEITKCEKGTSYRITWPTGMRRAFTLFCTIKGVNLGLWHKQPSYLDRSAMSTWLFFRLKAPLKGPQSFQKAWIQLRQATRRPRRRPEDPPVHLTAPARPSLAPSRSTGGCTGFGPPLGRAWAPGRRVLHQKHARKALKPMAGRPT